MAAVNMHDAKSRLSSLVADIESGREQEIVIARNGRPVARLVPLASLAPAAVGLRIGVAKGKYKIPATIDEYEDEIAEMFGVKE